MNTGKDCWSYCNGQQGPCSWCGSEGMCCTQKSGYPASNGCDGSFGGQTMHECALKPGKICLPIFMFQLHITKLNECVNKIKTTLYIPDTATEAPPSVGKTSKLFECAPAK